MRTADTPLPASRRRRVELIVALSVAWLLVLARSVLYVVYPHASFDSDQAIVGLMAKHLAEGRAFPLYLYGYHYMLAVEAWLAVPYFWIAGPTVPALRASIIGTNLAVVTLLIVGLQREGGLRPYAAMVATLFFSLAPPDTTANLIDAGGGNIEPFLWVLILWFVRARPFWFGSVLAIGYLNREFTVYAVPVLIAGQIWSGAALRIQTWRSWLFALVAFLIVWQGVRGLVPLADLAGPGTRGRASVSLDDSPLENVSRRTRIEVTSAPAGVRTLLSRDVPALLGGRPIATNLASQGRTWIGWLLGLGAAAAVARVTWLARRGSLPLRTAATGWYLLGIGIMAVVGYALTRPVEVVIGRYILLSLLIPAGATAIWLALEPVRTIRYAVTALVLVWAAGSAVDNWRQYSRFASGQIPDAMQEIIAALDARGVTVIAAPHWRAYKLAFLTGERIKSASTDVVRIDEYERLAAAEGDRLVRLQDKACPGGTLVAGWYICN